VQVRSGGAAFVPAEGDELAAADGLPDGDGPAADVAVDGGDAAGLRLGLGKRRGIGVTTVGCCVDVRRGFNFHQVR